MRIMPSGSVHPQCPSARWMPIALLVVSLTPGCRARLDSIRVVLDRHAEAVERLPSKERSQLAPYGAPVATEHAEDLLPDGVLTLETARSIAVRANPDVHAALARLEAARARIAEAQARYFPTVVFTHTSVRTFHTPASRNRLNTLLQPAQPVPTDIDTQNLAVTTLVNAIRRPLFGLGKAEGNRNPFSEHSSALAATWIVFDGFVREAQLLSAKHLHNAAMQSLVDVERLIIQAVDTAYHQVQLAEERLRIARAAEEFSREQLEETEKLHKNERATKADVGNFRVRMLAAKANVTAAVGLRDTGRVVLAELLGLSDVVLPPERQLSPLVEETEEEMTVPDVEVWVERATANRPDLLQLEAVLESNEENVRAAKGLYSPSVAVSGSWGYDRSSNLRYTYEDQSSAAAVELQWELYTGGALRAGVRAAESARAEAAAALSRLRLAVQAQTRRAIIDLADAQERIRLQRENLETARENRRIIQAAYVAERETLTRLNEAQRDFIQADASLALARIRLRQAWSDLHAAAATYQELSPEGSSVGTSPPTGP
ncbi:MAG: TolC family protein [Phycisphaerales bacterium]|nr:MAG: TolC family protein [Phycisphaerales bacterium]